MHTSPNLQIDWQHGRGCAAHYQWLLKHGDHLVPLAGRAIRDVSYRLLRLGRRLLDLAAGDRGLRFTAAPGGIDALSERGVEREWFAHVVRRCWFPPVYQVRGRQVVHASAVLHSETGGAVAFVGPSGAGKSTFAYGLAARPGWRQLSDDAMALSSASGGIVLHPIDHEPRLRPASADYFNVRGRSLSGAAWPAHEVRLSRIYFLEPHDEDLAGHRAIVFAPLRATGAYQRLLKQAHALTLKIPALNRRLMLDYLAVTAAIPTYRLAYRRSFDHIERIFDVIEDDTIAGALRERVVSDKVLAAAR